MNLFLISMLPILIGSNNMDISFSFKFIWTTLSENYKEGANRLSRLHS